MKKNWTPVLIGLALLAGLTLLIVPRLTLGGDGGGESNGSGPERSALTVDLHVVVSGPLQDRTVTTGSLLANESVEIRTEASGRLVEIGFDEGGSVSRGDLLVKVNDRDLQARLRQVESQSDLLRQREFRQVRLLEEGGVRAEDLEETRNEMEVLEAEKDMVRAEIEKTEVRAPFSGRVGLREVSPGSFINSDTHVTTLQAMDPLRLDLSIPARYADRVQEGTPVRFRVEGSDEAHEAVIYAIDPGLETGTRTLRLRARTDNPDGRLRPGGFATVEVIFAEQDDALTVPSIAVRADADGTRVFVYRGGEAEAVPVRVGIRTRDAVQVVEGLSPGDSVITTGFQRLRSGMEVQAAEITEGGMEFEDSLLDEALPAPDGGTGGSDARIGGPDADAGAQVWDEDAAGGRGP